MQDYYYRSARSAGEPASLTLSGLSPGAAYTPSETITLGGYRTPVPMRRLEDLDAEIGILPELRESLAEDSEERSLAVLKEINGGGVGPDAPDLGPDGIVVVPGKSWLNPR